RLALVETICAQRSELFIRTSSFVNRTSLQLSIWRIGRATSFNCRSNNPDKQPCGICKTDAARLFSRKRVILSANLADN
ncbi:MAG: hypothetical protein IJE66_04650, partial [Akkermansia sp.]|nr:hypothetical protein [Akkermansia sp.]